MHHPTRTRSLPVTAAALFLLAAATTASAQTYGGRATCAQVDGARFADTGELPPSGGSLAASEGSIKYLVLSTGAASASCSGVSGIAQSSASVDDIVVGGTLADVLTCARVAVQTGASCGGVQGSSEITSLVFAGVAVAVTGEANQTVVVPGVGTLVINERIEGSGSIRLNALRLSLATGVDIVLGACESSFVCPLAVEPDTWGSVKGLYR